MRVPGVFGKGLLIGLWLILAGSIVGNAQTLDKAFQDILAHPDLKGANVSLLVVDLATGQTIYEKNADKPVIPASNMKLLTAGAAWAMLGSEYRFPTDILSRAFARETGELDGLLVVGRGDPSFSGKFFESSNAAMDSLADELAQRGVGRIKDDIWLDGSFFPEQRYPTNWEDDDKPYCYAPKLGALPASGNCLRAILTGAGGSTLAEIDPSPGEAYVKLSLTKASKKSWGQIKGDGPDFKISGAVTAGRMVELERPVGDPDLFFGAVFAQSLKRRGIAFDGRLQKLPRGKSSEEFRLFHRHEGRPLGEILGVMVKDSDNFIAEQMLWAMGGLLGGGAGEKEGAAVVQKFLNGLSLQGLESLRVDDGSGMSRKNKLNARLLTSLLEAYYRSAWSWSFRDLLAQPGGDGTLEKRLTGAETAGRIWAKTGAIRGVCTISGYIKLKNGDMAAFSLLFNDFAVRAGRIRNLQDKMLKTLAEWPF